MFLNGRTAMEFCHSDVGSVFDFSMLDELLPLSDSEAGNPNLFSKEDIERAKTLGADDFMVKAYYTTEEILKKM